MENNFDLSKISNLSDEKLKELIKQIASVTGVNDKMLEGILSDMTNVRNVASSLSQSDVERLLSNLGEENAKKLSDVLSK